MLWIVPLVLVYATVCAVCDARAWTIPNKLTLPALALALVYRAVSGLSAPDTWLAAVAGLVLIYVAWQNGFYGGGDAKVLMGLWLVWPVASFLVVLCAMFPVYYLVRRLVRSTPGFPAAVPTALGVWVYSLSMLLATFSSGYQALPVLSLFS
ncbi:MAG: prepilin peptidase [Thermoflexales bacterium]|nr:prepilin peptidase [Thermoflexales bacterium]